MLVKEYLRMPSASLMEHCWLDSSATNRACQLTIMNLSKMMDCKPSTVLQYVRRASGRGLNLLNEMHIIVV